MLLGLIFNFNKLLYLLSLSTFVSVFELFTETTVLILRSQYFVQYSADTTPPCITCVFTAACCHRQYSFQGSIQLISRNQKGHPAISSKRFLVDLSIPLRSAFLLEILVSVYRAVLKLMNSSVISAMSIRLNTLRRLNKLLT